MKSGSALQRLDWSGEDSDHLIAQRKTCGDDFSGESVAETMITSTCLTSTSAGDDEEVRVFLTRLAPVTFLNVCTDGTADLLAHQPVALGKSSE